jgi:CHAD domain-containing protein
MGTAYASASNSTLGAYVAAQIALRIQRLAFELSNARRVMNEESVHDLRVSLRRLIEGIRVSRALLPHEGAKETLADLRKMMDAAGRVRSCDIAADLLARAGAPPDAEVVVRLRLERSLAAQVLRQEMLRAYKQDATRRWRRRLELA